MFGKIKQRIKRLEKALEDLNAGLKRQKMADELVKLAEEFGLGTYYWDIAINKFRNPYDYWLNTGETFESIEKLVNQAKLKKYEQCRAKGECK